MSFLVAMTSGLIVDLIARPLAKRLPNGRYRLEVEVTDRIRGETRRRVVELTLVD